MDKTVISSEVEGPGFNFAKFHSNGNAVEPKKGTKAIPLLTRNLNVVEED